MTDPLNVTIKCTCKKVLQVEKGDQGSYRVRCKNCNVMTAWFLKAETALNSWLEHHMKGGNKLGMMEVKQ